jgi:hypothetical protein
VSRRRIEPPVSYLYRCDGDMICARRPARVRLLALLAVVVFAASWVWPVLGILHSQLCLFVGTVWCALISGPQEVRLDLQVRTYLYRGSWWHQFRAVRGPLSDVAAVGVQNFPLGARPNVYELYLIWDVPHRRETFLARYATREEAEAERVLLAKRLGC